MNTHNIQKKQKTSSSPMRSVFFNELSQNLSVSYQGLEEQVAKLHGELAFAHSERLKTLEEKEKLASRLEKILAALPPASLCWMWTEKFWIAMRSRQIFRRTADWPGLARCCRPQPDSRCRQPA